MRSDDGGVEPRDIYAVGEAIGDIYEELDGGIGVNCDDKWFCCSFLFCVDEEEEEERMGGAVVGYIVAYCIDDVVWIGVK